MGDMKVTVVGAMGVLGFLIAVALLFYVVKLKIRKGNDGDANRPQMFPRNPGF